LLSLPLSPLSLPLSLLLSPPPLLLRTTLLEAGFSHVQYTLVDCPGHASLIRTIIGGAQIIDLMLLVVDVTKGIQTQTAECLVIGELLSDRLVVVLNKVDKLRTKAKEKGVKDIEKEVRMILHSVFRWLSLLLSHPLFVPSLCLSLLSVCPFSLSVPSLCMSPSLSLCVPLSLSAPLSLSFISSPISISHPYPFYLPLSRHSPSSGRIQNHKNEGRPQSYVCSDQIRQRRSDGVCLR